jgi:ubiquinone/menaquinone biosynthesis C-methylase UbiE
VDPERYYTELAAAYVRGARPDLGGGDASELLAAAKRAGVRLHRFKRTAGLARVRRVIGALKGFAPSSLLDIGSGRGAFLWPLIDELAEISVTAVDLLPHRVADIDAVRRGGIERVRAATMDAAALTYPDRSFDAVTILEVLEHVERPAAVAREALRVARRVAIVTVPAKEDDNPEHIHLFSAADLTALLSEAGAARVEVEHVLGHRVAIAVPP